MPGRHFNCITTLLFLACTIFLCLSAQAIPKKSVQTIDLVISYKWVHYAKHWSKAIAVNDLIPGPTLYFKEGDDVAINVYNHLDKGTTIHWHGILVPWQMDGVENVNQKAIPPGSVFHYHFTLRQSGTYWYHAHADAQEQEGLYGAFIIDPLHRSRYHYNKNYVVVLSDWINAPAQQVFANLKKDGDYYSAKFKLQASLKKFIQDYRKADSTERKKLRTDYLMMQKSRMGIYDISDVAYDAFLLNGLTKDHPWTAPVKVGDVIRLRFIGAAASTIFRVKIANTVMQMVHVQGNDIKPTNISDFSIAPGETVDVLVKIKKDKPYIIYAESLDTLGAAYGALLTASNQFVDYKKITHFPEPLPVTRQMMKNIMMEKMALQKKGMLNEMNSTKMSAKPTIVGDVISSPNSYHAVTMGTKYQNLIAAVKTNDPQKPTDGIIRMELYGYMDSYIWFINGLPEYKAHPIVIEPGKRYRVIFTNHSMMNHPMHIHGHWFILRNGHGSYDPLLHTVEVPPGATVVADMDADGSGQWFFHCHHLYHMLAGMARVFQYETLIEVVKGQALPQNYVAKGTYINRPIIKVDEEIPIDKSLVTYPMAHAAGFYFANYLDIGADPIHNAQELTYTGLFGPDYNKLQLYVNDAELLQGYVDDADIDIFYWHSISQFWAIKGGANYFYKPTLKSYWQPGVGIEGLMPYFIATNFRTYYHSGSEKFDIELSRDTQITSNFLIRLGIRSILATKTVIQDQIGSGLNQMRFVVRPYYQVVPGLNIFTEYEREQYYGTFRHMEKANGEDTWTFGISLIF